MTISDAALPSLPKQCPECEAPQRRLWVLWGEHRRPRCEEVETGNWISLLRCPICGAFWCDSLYEPYASFPYAVYWSRSHMEWRIFHELDNGHTLLRWHAFAVVQHYRALPATELQLVEAHRKRSYGHNPIDNPFEFQATDLPSAG